MNIDELLADSSETKETVSQGDCLGKETVSGGKATLKEKKADSDNSKESGKSADKPVPAPATTTATEKKPAKKKGKPRGGNSPVIGNNGLQVEPGDNAKFLNVNMVLFNMESINLHDNEAVVNRLNEFFELYGKADMKPTVAGMAMALGMDRRTLWAITHDAPTGGAGYMTALPPGVANTIKKAYFLMENLWESYMNSGKINPVSGIFLGKNNFGYQDKTEYVLTPNAQQDESYSAEDIRERYIQADQQKRLSAASEESEDSNSD